jgi:2-amino-4-hydroxy-6-hydroxymethyldihydropteridine diphosphokinase
MRDEELGRKGKVKWEKAGFDANHPSFITAFIALGSNLGDPAGQIRSALRALDKLPDTRLVRQSSFYRNPPTGYLNQPEFVNAVARIETRLAPRDLLEQLLAIERAHGRVRDFPNGPRTLDLDILLYGERTVREPGLTIPHPRMVERAFVLVPLAEIAPETVVPGGARIADLAAKLDASGLVKLPETGNG